MINYGTCDEYSNLHSVIMCPPVNFEIIKPINIVQSKWHKRGLGPDPVRRLQQYAAYKDILINEGVVVWEVSPSKAFTYQVFTRDVGVVTKEGAIIANFKFSPRKGEEKEVVKELKRRSIAISHLFDEPAIFEGGDLIFIDQENVLIGFGDRTNLHALASLRSIESSFNVHSIQLPKDFLHLDVVLNIISPNTALAYTPALSADSLSLLEEFGLQIIEISSDEQETMATNVLAIGNGKIIAASCNKKTNNKMKKEGFEIIETEMSEILKGGGGPRCMTLPVFRK